MSNNETENASIRVKNRDIPVLQRVYAIMQEIRHYEDRCDWEHDRMYKITTHLSWTRGGSGGTHGFDDAFSRISEIEKNHREAVRRYTAELKRAEKIINEIPSETMRAFVMLVYVENVPEDEVKAELNMSAAGYKIARRAVEKATSMAAVKWHEKYVLEE